MTTRLGIVMRFLHVKTNLYPHTTFGIRRKFPHNFPTHPSFAKHKMIQLHGVQDIYHDEDNDYHTKMALRHAGYSNETIEEIMRMPRTASLGDCDDSTDCVPFAAQAPLDEKEQKEIDRLSKMSEEYAKRNG